MIEKLDKLLDWIYKKRCYFCKSSKESVRMCSKCFNNLEFLPLTVNRICNGANVYCAGEYSKDLQKLIRGLKYHNQRELAYYQAKFMWQYWQDLELDGNFDIIPVPIYYKRLKKRKYNHMELVAKEFANFSKNYTVNTELITRIKDTKPQYNLKKIQRLENLANAFEVNPQYYNRTKRLLIIDDICTTGSTFDEMVKTLNKQEIYDIVCFATTTPFGA